MSEIDPNPPELAAESGWNEVHPFPGQDSNRMFVGDRVKPDDRLAISYFLNEDKKLVGKVWFGPGAQGPPGYVHGGALSAVLDSIMGAAGWILGHKVLAVRLNLDLKRAVPLGSVLTFDSEILNIKDRKITVSARLIGENQTVHAQGEGLFITLREEHLKDFKNLG